MIGWLGDLTPPSALGRYTCEFLAAGGVHEIFIFCCAHAQDVKKYIDKTELERRLGTVRLTVIISNGPCFSAGDALRQVEAMGVITSDFVLVPGDVVANVQLAPLIAAHKQRRTLDPNAVLTTLMKRVPTTHHSRRAGEEKLVAMAGETGRLLMYDDASKSNDGTKKLKIPLSLLQESDRLQVCKDLYDTHIDICTVELLVLLQDNFDWQDLRRDVLSGILGQFEMLGKTIYTHVLTDEYAARVHDAHTYDAVSRDIIQRWAFPLVPDANLLPDSSCSYGRGCIYKEKGVSLARSCVLKRDSVIGSGSSVGEGTVISSSVLGRGCRIGAGVTLESCYLWGGVTVEDGATLQGVVCCDGVVVRAGAKLKVGTILGPKVVVGAAASPPAYSRFTLATAELMDGDDGDDEDDEDDEDGADAPSGGVAEVAAATAAALAEGGELLGADGVGQLWKVVPTPGSIGGASVAGAAGAAGGEEDDVEEESEEEEDELQEGDDFAEEEALNFASEVSDTVKRAIAASHSVDNVALEVNSLKFAQNRSFADCVQAILPALLETLDLDELPSAKKRVGAVKACLGRWGALLARFVQSPTEQDTLLTALVRHCDADETAREIFEHIANALYDCDDDILEEAAIERWAAAAAEEEEGSLPRRLLKQADAFLTWLREADSEDDEDDD